MSSLALQPPFVPTMPGSAAGWVVEIEFEGVISYENAVGGSEHAEKICAQAASIGATGKVWHWSPEFQHWQGVP